MYNMSFIKCRPYLISILLALGVGGLSAIAVAKGLPAYESLIKPALTPPSVLFPIVWSVLYALMGISAARIWRSADSGRGFALTVYAAQLLVNGVWSLLFFGCGAYLLSFIWLILLWLLVLAMILLFARIDRPAALLQIPYLLWISFAGYLNFALWYLNH